MTTTQKAPPRASITLNTLTITRIRLAAKYLDVKAFELIELGLDHLDIPRVPNPPAIRDIAASRLRAHLSIVGENGEDRDMINYFKKGAANDNE